MTQTDTPIAEMAERLGRFGHHPDAAIDFCIEVEELESIAVSARLGLTGMGHEEDRAAWPARIARAMTFKVGGDEGCVVAKAALRKLEKDGLALRSHLMGGSDRG